MAAKNSGLKIKNIAKAKPRLDIHPSLVQKVTY
jgi:hypothetical protein